MTGVGAADDLLVVGGGLAGLTAAVRAAELGARVTLLEAGTAEAYPCASRLAMGFINVAFHDVDEPLDVLRAAIDRATAGAAEPALADALARGAGPAVAWLRRQGVTLIRGNWRPGSAAMLAPPAAIGPGLAWQRRGPDRALRRLEARLAELGGRLRRGWRARALLLRDGACVGVRAECAGGAEAFPAAAVLLADGGFAGDGARVRRWIAPHGAPLQRNAGTARGDGLAMAEAAGALVTDLAGFYGHVQCRDALANPRLWPYPTCDHLCGAGIAVDAGGRRFADEGPGGVFLANAIARLPDPHGAVALFDHRAWLTRATAFPLPANPLLVTAGGTVHRAGSVAAVAARAGLPPIESAETVRRYNAALAGGGASRLWPPRSDAPFAPLPLAEPPFYAVPLVAGLTYTTGGIAIDADARVRRAGGGIVPGLYAAGAATGGHEGGAMAGYTGGLSKALVFGLRAAAASVADRGRRAA